jgi:hypothetical protein
MRSPHGQKKSELQKNISPCKRKIRKQQRRYGRKVKAKWKQGKINVVNQRDFLQTSA